MIEIIRQGIRRGNSGFRNKIITVCDECGCVFSFKDCYPNNNGDLMHDRALCEDYILCPECYNRISVHDTSCGADSDRFLCKII